MSPAVTADAIQVYRAKAEDRPEVEAVLSEYYEAVSVQARDDARQLQAYFEAGSGLWLASVSGCVAGCVAIRPLPDHPDACEIKRLYVREAFRGRGLADALLDAAENHAIVSGYAAAYLDSRDDLRAAIHFYRRRGYDACGRYNSNPQATIFMRRRLR